MNVQVHYSSSAGNLCRADNLLLEAGVSIREIKKALEFRLSDISGCLVSHEHGDHSKGARDLLKAGIDVYMGAETAAGLGLSGHRLHIVKPMEQLQIGDWIILPFPLVHDIENLGYLMARGGEKVVFLTDTNFVPYRFRGLTHILIAVDYDAEILKANTLAGIVDPERAKRTLQNHMSIQTALSFFRANDMSRVQGIWLLHLSDSNSDERRFRQEVEKVTGRPVYTQTERVGGVA